MIKISFHKPTLFPGPHLSFLSDIGHDLGHPLKKWCNKYILESKKLFAFILENLSFIINHGQEDLKLLSHGRIRVKLQRSRHINCQCRDKNQEFFLTHCIKCLSTVTLTKCGACLVSEWIFDSPKEILTIDVIPVFPVKLLAI